MTASRVWTLDAERGTLQYSPAKKIQISKTSLLGGIILENRTARRLADLLPFFINFAMSIAKKGCRQGPLSGNSMYTGIPGQSNDFAAIVLVTKS